MSAERELREEICEYRRLYAESQERLCILNSSKGALAKQSLVLFDKEKKQRRGARGDQEQSYRSEMYAQAAREQKTGSRNRSERQ